MHKKWMLASAAMISLFTTFAAHAAERDQATSDSAPRALPAPTHALELTLGTGYEQGFGNVNDGTKLGDFGQAGGAVHVGVGYRVLPRLTLGVFGGAAMYTRPSQDAAVDFSSYAAGVQADWHFTPAGAELDPWVSVGTGWRAYLANSTGVTAVMHGIDIAKMQVGVDYRLSPGIAVSPVLGVDLSTFVTASDGVHEFQNIQSPGVNAFVFAGVQGRFDLPLGKSGEAQVATR